jgi:hypothetical protein
MAVIPFEKERHPLVRWNLRIIGRRPVAGVGVAPALRRACVACVDLIA